MSSPAAVNGDVLTVAEAAAYLRVGPKAVRRLIRLKRIKAAVIDRRNTIRIHRDALDAFVKGEAR